MVQLDLAAATQPSMETDVEIDVVGAVGVD